jgi:TolB-like protein
MSEQTEGLISQLRNTAVIKTATVYVISGWLIIQFFDITLEAFEAPAWIMRSILTAVLAGFPLTLLVVTIIRRSSFSLMQGVAATITILLAIAASSYIYLQYSPEQAAEEFSKESDESESTPTRQQNPVIAILPFNNMSTDAENEFLADGMTEDIITLLAQSPGLEVIARNSTFRYKGTSPDVREVGTTLGADYVIEGSIRPFGDRVRVTVQVIETSNGAHIWAEQYDRPFSEFFAIQDEVSLGIAAASGDAVFRKE